MTAPTKHHPAMYRNTVGCWAMCLCGWASPLFTTMPDARLAFGQHLAEVSS